MLEHYQAKHSAILFFHLLLSLLLLERKILWLEGGCQAGTVFIFIARGILWLLRPGDTCDPVTRMCFFLAYLQTYEAHQSQTATPLNRLVFTAPLRLAVRGFFLCHKTDSLLMAFSQSFRLGSKPQHLQLQSHRHPPIHRARIHVGSPAQCGGSSMQSPARRSFSCLAPPYGNLWRTELSASAPGPSLASNYPGPICHPIWGIFAAWLTQGLKRQHKTGHVATLPTGRG